MVEPWIVWACFGAKTLEYIQTFSMLEGGKWNVQIKKWPPLHWDQVR
jgi:hypothetical protein